MQNYMQPYQPGYTGYQQPEDRVVGVSGIDEVKAYPMPPSSRFPFFSTVEDVCYIKRTDSNGAYSITVLDFTVREQPSETVTRAEFDELKSMLKEIRDAQHAVSKPAEEVPAG